ncbi:Hypothetical protein POVN_LOCUS505 [uncultured virus]|nr:Hypothetical protein POVN_LOCUS505 [uncultured virus]
MARVYDFTDVIELLADELKKYKAAPTPEKAAQLNSWIADSMNGNEFDFGEALAQSINMKVGALRQRTRLPCFLLLPPRTNGTL